MLVYPIANLLNNTSFYLTSRFMQPALLKLDNISYSVGQKQLLHDINFSLHRAEIIGLLGVNGAGKSTTLKIIAGILIPSNGYLHATQRYKVGYVPEVPPLLPHWTVARFLSHACNLHSISILQQKNAIARVSEQLELHTILHKYCNTLSKGNQQRVSIAQALLHNPDVLVLDEPTSGLDPRQTNIFRDLLCHLKTDAAIILSSHIMQEITAICDRSIVIHHGKQAGEILLSKRANQCLVEFSCTVSEAVFAQFAAWQSGHQHLHQFSLDHHKVNDILRFCLDKALPVARVIGIEEVIEQEFLSLIGSANAQ